MKKDILDIIKEKTPDSHQLPQNHRAQFYEKLMKQKEQKPKNNLYFKIAATAAILVIGSFFTWNYVTAIPEESMGNSNLSLVKIESDYQLKIEKEWNSLLHLTSDSTLIYRYEKKLLQLNDDYKNLTQEYSGDSNNIELIENLVQNLEYRLQLLQDIQSHIKQIKDTTDETTI